MSVTIDDTTAQAIIKLLEANRVTDVDTGTAVDMPFERTSQVDCLLDSFKQQVKETKTP